MNSWTLSLFRQTRAYLTVSSFWRYRKFVIEGPKPSFNGLLPLTFRAPKHTMYLRVPGSDPLTFEEVFRQEVYREVLNVVPSCDTLVDLGANIGLATLYFSRHYGCRCFCVESNPDTFRVLQTNLAGIPAELLNAAVWSSETAMQSTCESAHYSMATAVPSVDGNIPGVTVSEIIRRSGFPRVDLLKIDIEGAEVEAFRGDTSWLRQVGAIALEFHGDSRGQIGFDALMDKFGFTILGAGHTTIA